MEWTEMCIRLHELRTQLPATDDTTFQTYVTLGADYPGGTINIEMLPAAIRHFQGTMQGKHDVLMGVMIEESHVICGIYDEPIWLLYCNQYPRFPHQRSTIEWYICELALYLMHRFEQERISVTLPDKTLVYDAAAIPSHDESRSMYESAEAEEHGSEASCSCQHDNPEGIPDESCHCNDDRTPAQLQGWETLRKHDPVITNEAAVRKVAFVNDIYEAARHEHTGCTVDAKEAVGMEPGKGEEEHGNETPVPIEDTLEDSDPCVGCADYDDCGTRVEPENHCLEAKDIRMVDSAEAAKLRPGFVTVEAVANPEPGCAAKTPAEVLCTCTPGDPAQACNLCQGDKPAIEETPCKT